MYKRILVGVDGSKQSEQALLKAIELATVNNATLIIGHVIDVKNLPSGSHSLYTGNLIVAWEKKTESMLQVYKEQAQKNGLENVETYYINGNPRVDVSNKLVKERNADLLITSRTGRNRIEKFLTGSVAEASIRNAPCDYLMVKDCEESSLKSYKNILIAVDGSEQADHAFEEAVRIAKQVGGFLTIANVIPNMVYVNGALSSVPLSVNNKAMKQSEELVQRYKEKAEAAGITKVQIDISIGDPRDMLTGMVPREVKPDLMICGATGQSRWIRFMVGSVADAMLRHAKCDVLAVKK
ncbi:universal stress protein [Alkalihalobacillus sp. 1P02AB]|uniref:universal stress protein n=1 Tax=Alkalihalobacillus sp. 1P02AB TaxID=3132260 RepID=UPI0039A75540